MAPDGMLPTGRDASWEHGVNDSSFIDMADGDTHSFSCNNVGEKHFVG